MAGTFDPNEAQNLAEVRHPVPRALRWLLRVLLAAGVVLDRETVSIHDSFYPAAAGGSL